MPRSNPAHSKLPMEHPDYRYGVSKNPYARKLKDLSAIAHSDNEAEAHRGKWLTLFQDSAEAPKSRELRVELGCNGGHVTLEWAARDPKSGYIGLDYKHKQIYRGAEKAQERGIKNLIFVRANAVRISQIFAPAEIDRLYLFFPDPWPRKSQWKNRFITTARFNELAALVRPGGTFEIRTDHADYFAWMEDALASAEKSWKTLERSADFHAGNPNAKKLVIPEVTLFERLFIKDGLPVHRLLLERQ